jgi:hypothetical protein
MSTFLAKIRPFLSEKRSKREVKTAFLRLFWAFFGLKVFQMYQVCQLNYGTPSKNVYNDKNPIAKHINI